MKHSMNKGSISLIALAVFANSTVSGALAQNAAPESMGSIHKPINSQSTMELLKETLGDSQPRIKEVKQQAVQELRKHAEASKTPEKMKMVEKYDKKANEYFSQGRYNDALVAWQKAYGHSLEMKYSEGQGRALSGMCKIYVTQGKWVKARHLGENAVEVLAAIKDNVELGKARVALAQAYFGLENPLWATRQLDEALKLLMGQADKEPIAAAEMLKLAGAILFSHKKPLEGTRFYRQSIKYLEKGKQFPLALSMRIDLIAVMTELGWYVAAKEEAEKAVALAKRTKEPRAVISALCAQGNAQYVLGEYLQSKESYEKASEMVKALPKEKQVSKEGRANLMLGYAFGLAATGKSDRALNMLEKLAKFFDKKGKYLEQAEVCNAMGVIECNDGNYYKALPLLTKAHDIQGMLTPHKPRLEMYVLRNMAACEFRLGKYREAYGHLKNVSRIFNKKDVHKGFGLPKTRSYVGLSEAAMKMQDIPTAKRFIDASIKLGKRYKDDASLWRAYALDAQVKISEKKFDQAKESLKHSLSHFRSPQAGYFPAVEHIIYPTSRIDFGMQLVALTASQGMTEQALLVAEQLKEEKLINAWLVGKGTELKPKDKEVYFDLMKTRAHLHAAEQSTSPDKLTKEWGAWLKRFGTLARENRSLARLITPYPTDIPDVIKTAREKKLTVVEYLVGNKSSVAFTVDPKGRISATVLPVDEAMLKKQITTLLEANKAGNEENYQPTLKALYKELLPQSVRNFLPLSADQQIVFIPDGVLYNLPFAALIDENGEYFVENHLVTLVPSMRDLLDTSPGIPGALSVLVAQGENPRDRSETNTISQVVHPQPIATLGSKDLGALEEAAKNKSVVHFATTLPLVDSNPTNVQIPFVGADKLKRATAGNLFGLNIPSDLVVFSGTSVKGSKLQGKAVQMVSRGLTYAGARNVMMSLWETSPNAKVNELVNFYKNRKQGMNSARSLRQAQLLSMSRNRSPKNWATFQLLGIGM